jgi:hypothetical protein
MRSSVGRDENPLHEVTHVICGGEYCLAGRPSRSGSVVRVAGRGANKRDRAAA